MADERGQESEDNFETVSSCCADNFNRSPLMKLSVDHELNLHWSLSLEQHLTATNCRLPEGFSDNFQSKVEVDGPKFYQLEPCPGMLRPP